MRFLGLKQRRIRNIARRNLYEIVEDFSEVKSPCGLSYMLYDRLQSIGVDSRLFVVVARPRDRYIGHINLPRQNAHTFVFLAGRAFDPFYKEQASIDSYISKAYRPGAGVRLHIMDALEMTACPPDLGLRAWQS